nr:MAG TPA: hypothetical protein [Caudoviricetes sp.]
MEVAIADAIPRPVMKIWGFALHQLTMPLAMYLRFMVGCFLSKDGVPTGKYSVVCHLFWLLRLRYSSMYFSNFEPKALKRRKPIKPVAAILPVPPPRILEIALMIAMKAKKARMMMSMMMVPKVSIVVSFQSELIAKMSSSVSRDSARMGMKRASAPTLIESITR